MVESIVVKILVGMLGVLIFLRISGKTQMAQLTPLDSVNAFVLGALVGGSIYSPEMSVWYLVLALGVWTVFNMLIRFLLRFKHLRRLIKGDTVMIVRDGKIDLREFRRNGLEMEQFRTMLRENGIFSMLEVDDVRFETNGRLTVSRRGDRSQSYLLVNNGAVLESSLWNAGKSEQWLKESLGKLGYDDPGDLFCVEWTPSQGFYVTPKNGDAASTMRPARRSSAIESCLAADPAFRSCAVRAEEGRRRFPPSPPATYS
ncbi:MAG: DUF421 domain-containing protein [Alistipes ihumii]